MKLRSKYFGFVCLLVWPACTLKEAKPKVEVENPIALTREQANQLADLPLACMQNEYPNKLGQTLGNPVDLKEPRILHPAFYGCFDWHSSVHGHWSLIKLLKEFPGLENADLIREKLKENISPGNILGELDYFLGEHNQSYERTYGWGWLLKLAEELHTWDDPFARELELNLQPLTDLVVERYLEFLPKLVYPIRVGEHTNTAFGLTFAWDYAQATEHKDMMTAISTRAKAFYMEDRACPISWEPSGYDFLSPCLEEIDLMRRVLDIDSFKGWMLKFAPQLLDPHYQLPVGEVSDRSDGKLVHLDGLNFSRAWVLYGLAVQYPEYKHLQSIANAHVNYSFPNLVGDGYEGGHWLGSFAIYALINN
jgi:hypothetical protein